MRQLHINRTMNQEIDQNDAKRNNSKSSNTPYSKQPQKFLQYLKKRSKSKRKGINAYQIVLLSPNLDRVFPRIKNAKEKVLLSFHSSFLYQNPCSSHFPLRFSLLQLWKMSTSASKISPINTSHSHVVSFSLHIYSLASPPRIHMDSWWAARNLNQGPKWTQNISQDRSRAYGLEPCRIWAPKSPKSPKSVLYTSQPNEPIEPVTNQSSRLRKKLKFLQNIS